MRASIVGKMDAQSLSHPTNAKRNRNVWFGRAVQGLLSPKTSFIRRPPSRHSDSCAWPALHDEVPVVPGTYSSRGIFSRRYKTSTAPCLSRCITQPCQQKRSFANPTSGTSSTSSSWDTFGLDNENPLRLCGMNFLS